MHFCSCRCGQTANVYGDVVSLSKMTCGDVNNPLWTRGVVMKSSCKLPLNNQNTNKCQTVQQLNMALQQEMPVFDWSNNVTYRSVTCARCNNGEKISYWGLKIRCTIALQPPQQNISAIKRFLKEHEDCSWWYAAFTSLQQRVKFCVVHDSVCDSNQLPVMSVIRELCSAYSMPMPNAGETCSYRNPHCALCNPNGRRISNKEVDTGGAPGPPLSILFDMGSNFLHKEALQTAQPPTQMYNQTLQSYNLSSQVANCSSNMKNCTAIFGGKVCVLLTSPMNQTAQMFLNTSGVKVLTPKQLLLDKSAMKPKKNILFFLCPDGETIKYEQHEFSAVHSYITFTGTILSVISLCFLLGVYLSFKELRNLPGKCLISLSWALLCYQVLFLFVEKPKEVEAFCKAVAICIHFFILAAFSWMSVMALDTAKTFKVQCKYRLSERSVPYRKLSK